MVAGPTHVIGMLFRVISESMSHTLVPAATTKGNGLSFSLIGMNLKLHAPARNE